MFEGLIVGEDTHDAERSGELVLPWTRLGLDKLSPEVQRAVPRAVEILEAAEL